MMIPLWLTNSSFWQHPLISFSSNECSVFSWLAFENKELEAFYHLQHQSLSTPFCATILFDFGLK
jgi:hypothetical protein